MSGFHIWPACLFVKQHLSCCLCTSLPAFMDFRHFGKTILAARKSLITFLPLERSEVRSIALLRPPVVPFLTPLPFFGWRVPPLE